MCAARVSVWIFPLPTPSWCTINGNVAVAHKNRCPYLFLNGKFSEEIEYTQGMLPRTNELLYIGTWPNALAFAYVGTLDRIRFSDRALTETELDSNPSAFVPVEAWDLY